jgi:hypothetical protein
MKRVPARCVQVLASKEHDKAETLARVAFGGAWNGSFGFQRAIEWSASENWTPANLIALNVNGEMPFRGLLMRRE